MKSNNLFVLLFVLLLSSAIAHAQSGTIRVQKKGHLLKTQFDNINYRLVGIDQYGNVLDSAVIEYEIAVTIKGLFYSEKNVGPYLSSTLQEILSRADQTTLLSFDKIKARDRDGTIVEMQKTKFKYAYDSNEYDD